jgi:hypothetical protein
MSKKNSDQLFARLLQNDSIGKPDETVEQRLMYSFLLKSGGSKQRQNSMSGFLGLGWLVSTQSIGLKIALVSVVLFFSLINNQNNTESKTNIGNDSLTAKRVLVADSTVFKQSLDSIFPNSLN